jgi:hypothetical protein
MTELRRFGWTDFLFLVLVLLAAAGARVGYLLVYADRAGNAGPYLVQGPPTPLTDLPPKTELRGQARPTELDSLVHNLKEHQWFGSLAPFAAGEEQTAHVAPGYPWLLSLLARVLDPASFEPAVRWIQAGLGTLTAGLYFLFARRAFRSLAVGTVAGLFVALHPFWVIDTASLSDGTLAATVIALALFLGARASQTAGPFASLLYGLTLAGAALVRAAFLPFSFAALVWFLLHSRTESRGWLGALLAFLGFANGLAPWTVRNYQVFGEPVPVVDSTYLHLWIGNNPHATGGPVTEQAVREADAQEIEKSDTGKPLSLRDIKEQPRRYNKLGGLVLKEVKRDPAGTLHRRLNAFVYFFLGEHYFRTGHLGEARGSLSEVERAGFEEVLAATLLVLLLLAPIGWRWSYAWRAETMPLSLAVLWLPVPYILGHASALHGPRLPLDGALLCYVAFALVCLVPGYGTALREGVRKAPAEEPPVPIAPPAPAQAQGRPARATWR